MKEITKLNIARFILFVIIIIMMLIATVSKTIIIPIGTMSWIFILMKISEWVDTANEIDKDNMLKYVK